MEYEVLAGKLSKMLRPQTLPLGVHLLRKGETLQEKAVRPAKYGIRISLCQWTTMARTWGRTAGVLPEDVNCSPCLAALGLKRLDDRNDLAGYFMDMGYFEQPDAAARAVDQLNPAPAGVIRGLVLSPLEKAAGIDPDLVWIYGTPAQMARLAAGWVYKAGVLVRSATTGFGLSCLSMVQPFFTGKPILVHPGRGERILAGTEEGEMAFSFPAAGLADLVEGLERTHETGTRYPIQKYMIYEPPLLKAMAALDERLSPAD